MATAEQINNRKRVLKFIETFPQFHNQETYVCKSTACIAGTALLFEAFGNSVVRVSDILTVGNGDLDSIPGYTEDDFSWEFKRGRDLLGLDDEEAQDLFYTWDESEAVYKLRFLANEEPDET